MSECRNEACNNDVVGRSAYCGDACRKAWSRRKVVNQTINEHPATSEVESVTTVTQISVTNCDIPTVTSVTDETVTSSVTEAQSQVIRPEPTALDHYYANPDMYATRNSPELLNWGEPMSLMGLQQAGLKANRVTIPGDWDYSGVCEQVDGKWQVKS